MQEVALRITQGERIHRVLYAVTPGGGKSGAPVILASTLIPTVTEKLLWVAPRNALKRQGEAEFLDSEWNTPRRLRSASGNEASPDRGGADGYLTTYQAVGTSPDSHLRYVERHTTILFLDEPHHVAADSAWARAIAPMVERAVLTVYASGTFSRADGRPIFGMDYNARGLVDFRPSAGTAVIRYGRKQAIADGAIIDPKLMVIDGAASWVSREGVRMDVGSIAAAGQERGDAVFTALRTDFAFALLGTAVRHWQDHHAQYPAAKLLVVAPDIKTAKVYQGRLAATCLSEIATTDDTAAAYRAIEDFKRGAVDALVTVGMAYEGLSVPQITHIACLTHIRSWPWLEQMAARGNRLAPGKTEAWIFAPADRAMAEAWRAIQNETLVPLSDADEWGERSAPADDEDLLGIARDRMTPLWSTAHGVQEVLPDAPREVAPSVAEKVLRENIRGMRRVYVDQALPGNQKARATIWDLRVREYLGGKGLDEADSSELTSAWIKLREKFKL